MALHVIVGKGPVGTTTAELVPRGYTVRVLSRAGRSTADMEHTRSARPIPSAVGAAARGAQPSTTR